jgi:glycosyltransferase involved in cell wall biosynthesis
VTAFPSRVWRHCRRVGQAFLDPVWSRLLARLGQADVSFFHQFQPPPSGGGHQFMRALKRVFEEQGLRVESNILSRATPACLFNSFNFDFKRLRRLARPDCRLVHRVDGPIGVYRGFDDGSDRRILEVNRQLANVTIFQSRYSLDQHRQLGMEFVNPRIIPNAPDPLLFFPKGHGAFQPGRPLRVIAASWSDNPKKGAAVYQWLDKHLDHSRVTFTFVGRSRIRFDRIRMLPPVPTETLARLLREHDVYLTASQDDPCSNALLEALSCGLPAVYRDSGGHPELVGEAGLGFQTPEEIPALLDRMAEEYSRFQAAIRVAGLADIASHYHDALFAPL